MSMQKNAGKLKLADLIQRFKADPQSKWSEWSESTKRTLGIEFDFIQRSAFGATPVDELDPYEVKQYLKSWHGKPGKQTNIYAALQAVERWAIGDRLLPRQICVGVRPKGPTGHHIPWEPEQVRLAQMEARPDLARVVTLGAWTGQRKSDLVRMCWSDIEESDGDKYFHVIQQKTGREVYPPIYPELQRELDGWERWPGPILRRGNEATGDFWTPKSLQAAWKYELDINPKLKELRGLVLHGLRGHACVRAKREGMSIPLIASTVGMSNKMVERYTKGSKALEDSKAAINFLKEKQRREQHTASPRSAVSRA